MKQLHLKLAYFLLSCLFFVALALGIVTLNPTLAVNANAAVVFNADTYKTAGASVRLYEKDGSALEDGLSGIRFHVLMDAELYNTYKDDANFKSYTAILPQYLLSGELTCNTANVLVLETTNVWRVYKRDSTYMESVAFLYGLPVSQHATEIAFRGFISLDGGKTYAQSTNTDTRSIAFVAKSARDDADAVLADATLESNRITTLNCYIPKYNVTYTVGSTSTTENAEYGDTLSSAPQGISIWRDENGNLVNLDSAITKNNTSGTNAQPLSLTAYAKVTMSLSNANATFNGANMSNGASVEVKCGTYPLTATPITNYKLSSVTINGANKGAGTSHSLSVTSNTTISVAATIITYTVTLDNSGGASVSGTVNGTFNINSTCSFTLGTGFYNVTVNGTTISPNTSRGYSFTVTANSTVKIVKMTDSETKSKIMNAIASASGGTLSVSGNNLVSPSNTSTITIGQAVFDELKKYGYTTVTFDIYKPQKKELLYRKRIQNITDNVTIAEVKVNQSSISATGVSLSKPTQLEGQYKSLGSWSGESIGVSWTLSNISFS